VELTLQIRFRTRSCALGILPDWEGQGPQRVLPRSEEDMAMASGRNPRTFARAWLDRRAAWLLLVLAAWLLLQLKLAGATPLRSVLVLGVSVDGQQHEQLRRQLSAQGKLVGAQVIDDLGLAPAARACTDDACLGMLAQRYRADMIMSARLRTQPGGDYLVEVSVFSAKSARTQLGSGRCDFQTLPGCVSELAGRVVASARTGWVAPKSKASVPVPGVLVQPVVPAALPAPLPSSVDEAIAVPPAVATHRRLSRLRIGVGVTLGVLSIGTLATGIGVLRTLQGTDGEPGKCPPVYGVQGCGYELTRAVIPSHVTAGLLAAGAALVFTWPIASNHKKEAE
jgi:hypothetical protein